MVVTVPSVDRPLAVKPMRFEPKLRLSGTQLAGWTPTASAQASSDGILFDENVRIPMPDGVELVADLFRPAGLGPAPVLVSWAAYIKETERFGGGPFIDESGVSPFVIKSGYAILRIQPRGAGGSQGAEPEEVFTPEEAQDCHDAIEWAARQSWCDGSVGMTGMSYFAISQLLVAATRPPSLKAIFPYKAMTDVYRHGFFKGGAAYSGFIELFAAFEKTAPPRIASGIRHFLSRFLNNRHFETEMSDPAKTQRMVRGFLKRTPPPEGAVRAYVARMFDRVFDDGDFWRRKSAGPKLDQITVPVCIATDFGAQDIHLFGAFEAWHRITSDKWLFIGPPEYKFPWSNYQRELVAWYDHHLKGLDNGYGQLARVRYWLSGADTWQDAADWPLPNARLQKLYLGSTTPDPTGRHDLTPSPAAEATQSYLAIPSTSYYVAQVDDYEAQVLRFSTPTYSAPVDIVGPVTLNLTMSATAIDAYVIARLSDVAPDGRRVKLSWGWLLASHRTIDPDRSTPSEIVHDHSSDAAVQLKPGEPATLRFSLNPVAVRMRPGHRLELELASRPELISTEAGEGFDMFFWDPVPYRSRNTVHLGGASCYLEISVL